MSTWPRSAPCRTARARSPGRAPRRPRRGWRRRPAPPAAGRWTPCPRRCARRRRRRGRGRTRPDPAAPDAAAAQVDSTPSTSRAAAAAIFATIWSAIQVDPPSAWGRGPGHLVGAHGDLLGGAGDSDPSGRYGGGVGWRDLLRTGWAGVAAGLAGVVLVTLAVELASHRIDVLSMAVVYQLLVLLVSAAWGLPRPGSRRASRRCWRSTGSSSRRPGPSRSTTSGAGSRWRCSPVTAVITSRLTADARRRRRESETRRREAERLSALAQTVLEEIGPGPPGPAVAEAAARALGVQRCALVHRPAARRRAATARGRG